MFISEEVFRLTHFSIIVAIAVLGFKVISLEDAIDKLSRPVDHLSKRSDQTSLCNDSKLPVVWIHGKSTNYDYLVHVKNVFEQMGFRVLTGDTTEKFDVWWNHEFPFQNSALLSKVKSLTHRQLLNHVPGSGYITSKVTLASTPLSRGLPRAFALPQQKDEYLEYARNNPEVLWVQKSNAHRGVKVMKPKDVDFSKQDTFVQQFIDRVLTIDGKKFDIGIYTVVTSVSPLRVYIYDNDMLLRFCSKSYKPFDANDVDKYVVGDDYTPIWEMPSFESYFNKQQLNSKESFRAYCADGKCDFDKIWSQIRQTISEVFVLNNERMRNLLRNYPYKRSFFEMVRFDFIVDEQMNLWLMEVNMSPNLSSGHFKQNAKLYEQVLLNLFSLVGIQSEYKKRSVNVNQLDISDRDLFVDLKECYNGSCTGCPRNNTENCGLCFECIDKNFMIDLRAAQREHLERRQMKRVVPSHWTSDAKLTRQDLLQNRWFTEMCKKDNSYCD
ncbi:putative tubulin polyglutamylase ttll-15 [Aphelenchoides besseyi]|nr:putative tubulin polyglutamylase ttll-15 [Aphelenchoides besseyi]